MQSKDQRLLNEAYQTICLEEQIQQELNDMLLREDILKWMGDKADKVANFGQDVSKVAKGAWDTVSMDVPDLITKLGNYVANLGMQAAAGGAGTYIVGQALMALVKKMNKEADQNYQIMMQMLPSEVQKKIAQIDSMDKNSPEYKAELFKINKNALKELERALNSKGFKTRSGIFAKILQYIGNFFASTAGSIAGAIVIPVLLQKMGFNPFPAFGVGG
jgi:hypothetical protein